MLAVIDQLPNEDLKGDESERGEVRRQAIKGEALLARAYAHFMLVNLFAKHYDPNTATSDLGIPYVTTPETEFIKEYNRASVARVYDLVEQDMLEGIIAGQRFVLRRLRQIPLYARVGAGLCLSLLPV